MSPELAKSPIDVATHRTPPFESPPAEAARAQVTQSAAGTIITRLLLRYGVSARIRRTGVQSPVAPAQIQALVELAMRGDGAAASVFTDGLCDEGVPLDVVFHDVLLGAARQLEGLWRDDRCSSTDLTIGVCNLRLLVSRLMVRAVEPVMPSRRVGHAAVVSLSGDRASVDPIVHQVYLWEAGWDVEGFEGLEEGALIDRFRRQAVDLALVSIASAAQVPRLTRLMRALPRRSRNPALRLVILAGAYGGPMAPLLALAADGIVRDPLETLWEAEWCRPMPHRAAGTGDDHAGPVPGIGAPAGYA